MVPAVAHAGIGPVLPGPTGRADVSLDTQDRPDPTLVTGFIEGHRAEHVAVVGDGDGRGAQVGDPIGQAVDPVAAVQQRVLGVQVQVGEARAELAEQPIGNALAFRVIRLGRCHAR